MDCCSRQAYSELTELDQGYEKLCSVGDTNTRTDLHSRLSDTPASNLRLYCSTSLIYSTSPQSCCLPQHSAAPQRHSAVAVRESGTGTEPDDPRQVGLDHMTRARRQSRIPANHRSPRHDRRVVAVQGRAAAEPPGQGIAAAAGSEGTEEGDLPPTQTNLRYKIISEGANHTLSNQQTNDGL